MWNPKELNTDKTLYVAIVDAIEIDIEKGLLKPGDKMPTQRHIAEVIGVNLTTVTRAYNLAKKKGLLSAVTGKGTFVAYNSEETWPKIATDRDKIIDFGLVGALKIEHQEVNKIIADLALNNNISELLDYIPSNGLYEHRLSGKKWIARHGYNVDVDDIIICSGVMHAINCCLSSLFKFEDKIAVESLTFTGFINAAQLNNIKLESVEMDEEGMKPESLEILCKKQKIKGIYLMPNLQNPTATTMSYERKKALSLIIKKYDLILIEDDVYNIFDETFIPISSFIPDQSIYICGTSKNLYAGLRIAYSVVPQKYHKKFLHTVTTTVWMAPPISSEIVSQLIIRGVADEIVKTKRKIINDRLKITKRILKKYDVHGAENSQFVWLKLPKTISALEFEHLALLNKVRIIASNKFVVGHGALPNAVRISFANVKSNKVLITGLERLVQILEEPDLNRPSIM